MFCDQNDERNKKCKNRTQCFLLSCVATAQEPELFAGRVLTSGVTWNPTLGIKMVSTESLWVGRAFSELGTRTTVRVPQKGGKLPGNAWASLRAGGRVKGVP
mmetsp:Transcript_8462/g.16645  ORF Transcript_8462/g.16645 Transcript_8462/m.16645 type:complete len:102 (-) Transcript_8462:1633-1938(-)